MGVPVPEIAAPMDFSLRHLVLQSDAVVKAVLVILVLFSVWCWAVVIEKCIELRRASRAAHRLEAAIAENDDGRLLNYADPYPLAGVIAAGNREWQAGPGERGDESLQETRERIERAMQLELSVELRRLNHRVPFLATIGSAAPFIGLFGTVWGIMSTFIGIGAARDTSLATVAPGIAEALIATAIGLVAAIPAVIAYNKFATDIGRYRGRLHTAIGVWAGRLSKRLRPAG